MQPQQLQRRQRPQRRQEHKNQKKIGAHKAETIAKARKGGRVIFSMFARKMVTVAVTAGNGILNSMAVTVRIIGNAALPDTAAIMAMVVISVVMASPTTADAL